MAKTLAVMVPAVVLQLLVAPTPFEKHPEPVTVKVFEGEDVPTPTLPVFVTIKFVTPVDELITKEFVDVDVCIDNNAQGEVVPMPTLPF